MRGRASPKMAAMSLWSIAERAAITLRSLIWSQID